MARPDSTEQVDLRARVAELQAQQLPRLTWQDVFTLKDGSTLTDEQQAALNDYFGRFVQLPTNDKGESVCFGCGKSFGKGDALMGFLLSGAPGRTTWVWALAHGECRCRECGWPARAYHYDVGKVNGGEPVFTRINVTLAVHPDELRPSSGERQET